eukprot:GHVN01089791.1.p1 GENE.GHVN01089791.1~~GHVN01089791.1.p1  ORF type:complete len:250 (+),score=28.58 GHVN01089791.1:58-807(+)
MRASTRHAPTVALICGLLNALEAVGKSSSCLNLIGVALFASAEADPKSLRRNGLTSHRNRDTGNLGGMQLDVPSSKNTPSQWELPSGDNYPSVSEVVSIIPQKVVVVPGHALPYESNTIPVYQGRISNVLAQPYPSHGNVDVSLGGAQTHYLSGEPEKTTRVIQVGPSPYTPAHDINFYRPHTEIPSPPVEPTLGNDCQGKLTRCTTENQGGKRPSRSAQLQEKRMRKNIEKGAMEGARDGQKVFGAPG